MNLLSRRDFLKDTAAAVALLAGGSCFSSPLRALAADKPAGKEIWLLCDTPKMIKNAFTGVMVTNPGTVNVFDVKSGEVTKIDTPFYGHTVTQNPARPHEVVTFEKWGRRGALIDLRERAVITTAESEDGRIFFGHAVYINGGSLLLTSEDNYKRDKGQLIVRDASTLQKVGTIPTYGAKPHECILIDDGRTIVVANEGFFPKEGSKDKYTASNVAWIDVASGKLLHRIIPDPEKYSVYSHLAASPDGWISVVGEVIPDKSTGNGRIRLISPEGNVFAPHVPDDVAARMNGQVLTTIILDNSDIAAATLPYSNMAVLMNYKTQEFLGAIETLKEPKGLLTDLSAPAPAFGIFVSNATGRNLTKVVFPASQAAPAISLDKAPFGGNGSHMVRAYV